MNRAASVWLAISLMGPLVFTITERTSPVPSIRPPQLLFIHRESVKVANVDNYNAIETEAVRTCVRLKCPNTYFAIESGRDIHLVWFLTPVDSQEEVDRVNAVYAQNSELKRAMARIVKSKKDIVTASETGLVKYRAELSSRFPARTQVHDHRYQGC